MQRTLIISFAVLACAVILLSIAPALSPVAGQTIPPMPATSTPGGPTATPDPNGCNQPYCAPPIQTQAPTATPGGPTPTPDPNACNQPYCTPPIQPPRETATPGVDPGIGDDNPPTGPGIINTPMPQPLGLPDMAHLHFLPCIEGL
jgi:hypothetical protein